MAHVVDSIHPYFAGGLTPDERSAFEQHLAACPECAGAVTAARFARPVLPPPLPRAALQYAHPTSQHWSGNQSNPVVWYVVAGLTVLAASLVIGVVLGRESANTSSPAPKFAVVPSSDNDADAVDQADAASSDDAAADDNSDSADDHPQPPKPGPRIIRTPSASPSSDGNPGRYMVLGGSPSTDDDSSDTSSDSQNFVMIAPPRNSSAPRPQPRPHWRPGPQPRNAPRGNVQQDDESR